MISDQIKLILEKISQLEDELETEFTKQQAELSFTIHNRKVIFEREVLNRHKQLKTTLLNYILQANIKVIATAPLVYSLIIPFLLLDAMVTIYQWVCFPVYGFTRVKRHKYFIYDRHQLAYLNLLEKINCAYCSYGNGLIAYVREIASKTEEYWCPIKHARRIKAAHSRYHDFFDYGDAESYQEYLKKLDKELKERASKRIP